MKCDLCKEKIEELFLKKVKGTYIGPKTKRKLACHKCQGKHSMKDIKDKLKLQ